MSVPIDPTYQDLHIKTSRSRPTYQELHHGRLGAGGEARRVTKRRKRLSSSTLED